MKLYCANCGKRLEITRVALPKYSTIIDAVQWHECSAEVIPFEFTPNEFAPIVEGKDKSVKSLNGLRQINKRPFGGVGTEDLRDQRIDVEPLTKSSAPVSVLSMIERMNPTEPVNEIRDDSEMGD